MHCKFDMLVVLYSYKRKLQNIACQQHFDRDLLEQFNLYNTFGFTKRLICK